MAPEMSAEQRRRQVRRAVMAALILGLSIPISFLVLLILTYRGSDQHFSGARFYVGDALLILAGLAAAATALRAMRVRRAHPPVPASVDQRLRAGQAIRSGKVPADGDVELARAVADRTARIYRAQVVAMATVPLLLVALAIMVRGHALVIVFIIYAVLGWAMVFPSLLVVRRANRFLAESSGGQPR